MNAPSPRRWLEQEGDLAELLRQAQDEYQTDLEPGRALARFQPPAPARPVWRFLVPALALGALLVLPWWHSLSAWLKPEPLQLVAEQLPPPSKPVEDAAPVTTPDASATPPRSPAPGFKRRASAIGNEPAGNLVEKPAPEASSSSPGAAPPAVDTTESAKQEDCLAHARAGDPRRAADCFSERARGSGLSAQVALYELSRLQRDSLGDRAQALATLEQYLTRFPDGSLSGEARFSRLELLAKLGRVADAMTASSEFLSSRFGSERGAEVHLLRGNLLLRSLRQPQRAVEEYRAALGAPGRVGDEAAFQLGAALEGAGDRDAARAAYQQYLARPGARQSAAARARLEALTP